MRRGGGGSFIRNELMRFSRAKHFNRRKRERKPISRRSHISIIYTLFLLQNYTSSCTLGDESAEARVFKQKLGEKKTKFKGELRIEET